ncbi:hypothetical protein EYF80_046180 [Liparis tanakae]|uniref:Uncharacterized protein n=1 Tax=Liparis tanakae TaxID=230148 RepID=A0A4Z2FQY0_9TELE|nr:hypothetical protein EYF80_046180 [Liparis tanakae]
MYYKCTIKPTDSPWGNVHATFMLTEYKSQKGDGGRGKTNVLPQDKQREGRMRGEREGGRGGKEGGR